MSVLLAAVVSTLLGAAPGLNENARPDLVAAAFASPRPAECGRLTSTETEGPSWARLQEPALDKYCWFLAAGYASLVERKGAQALELARTARQLFPERIDAQVLEASALFSLGQVQEAWLGFTSAKVRDPRSVAAPMVLHDYAIAAAMTQHVGDALSAYRQLASRAALLADELRAARIYIEAGVVAMQTGPAGLDEALGYLDEARHGSSLLENWARVCLALVLERQGRQEQARGVLAEMDAPAELFDWAERASADEAEPVFTALGPRLPVLPSAELHALVALLHEGSDAASAIEQWQLYLRGAALPVAWRSHAEAKLAALRRRGRP